jgi:hypothetical protein
MNANQGGETMVQTINNQKSGASGTTTPAGSEAGASLSGELIEPDQIASGAVNSIRINPCEPAPETGGIPAGETPSILHATGRGETQKNHLRVTRCNPHVYEAMRLLASYGYKPAKLGECPVPVSIIGFRESGTIFVLVISARKAIPSGEKLRQEYKKQVEYLCSIAASLRYRLMIWVHSPECGWRYYTISPGGLEYDWKFPGSLEQ